MVAQPLDLLDGLGLGIGAESLVGRRNGAAEHEILPDHQAQFIGLFIDVVVLIDAAAPDAQDVHIGVDRRLQDLVLLPGRDAGREDIEGDQVGALGEDRDAVDHQGE